MRNKFLAVLFSLLFFSITTFASIVNVDCNGNTPGMPNSINTALSLLGPLDSSNTIIVSGTCNENVTVLNQRNLTITTPLNEIATIHGIDNTQPALHLIQSRGILIFNLQVNGGDQGILLNTSSQADIINTTVTGARNIGIHAQMGSTLTLNNVTVQENRDGVLVDGGSNATLAFGDPTTAVSIINNRRFGINVSGADVQSNGPLFVTGNGSAGVNANGARLVFNTAATISDNGNGFVVRGGTSTFPGELTISRNGNFGVLAIGATITFNGDTTIEGHASNGIFIDRASNVTLNATAKVRANGSAAADPNGSAGIFVNMGGVLLVNSSAVSITDNIGFGIGADQMGVVTVDGVNISGNARDGVHLGHMSNGFFGPAVNFGTNGGASITCDKTSYAFVDEHKNFTGTNCKNMEKK